MRSAMIACDRPAGGGRVLAALADDTRRDIVARLADGATPTATELAGQLPISRQAVTKQLRVLEQAGLVEVARRGREARYHLEVDALHEAAAWIDRVDARWERRLQTLKDQVEGGG